MNKVSPRVELARAEAEVAKANAKMVEAEEKRGQAQVKAGVTGDAHIKVTDKKKINLDFKSMSKKAQIIMVLVVLGVIVYFAITNWQILIAIVLIGGWGIWEYGKWKKKKQAEKK